jgi:DNA polymerase-1
MPTLLIDSHYLGYQAHYVLGGELSHDDIPTGVLFGFLSRVLHLCRLFETNNVVFCWDSRKSYRKRKYPWYKSGRAEKTDEELARLNILYSQLHLLRGSLLPLMGWLDQCVQTGCEADDIIAILVREVEDEWVIVSADSDLYQCLQNNVRIYNPSKHRVMTARRFRKEYGIEPAVWRDVKATAGCGSDSVPGVPGVGEKTAVKFYRGELPERYKAYKAIITNGDIIARNRRIVTIPISKAVLPILRGHKFNPPAFRDICTGYGMESFLAPEMWEQWAQVFENRIVQSERKPYPKVKVRRKRNAAAEGPSFGI